MPAPSPAPDPAAWPAGSGGGRPAGSRLDGRFRGDGGGGGEGDAGVWRRRQPRLVAIGLWTSQPKLWAEAAGIDQELVMHRRGLARTQAIRPGSESEAKLPP